VCLDGFRLAPVAWEEDVLRRNGYDDVAWLRVAEYRRVPKEARVRYLADLLRKLGISVQERLLAATERAWLDAGCARPTGGVGGVGSIGLGGIPGGGGSWRGQVGASGISAAEADVLMQDGGGGGRGWASGGRSSRGRHGTSGRGGSGRGGKKQQRW
jgi:hypothetical protein